MRIKVSLNSLKLGTIVVHATFIFLYFEISAKQNWYGFTRGDLSTRVPGFSGNSTNLGNYEGQLAREGRLALAR